MSIDYLNLDPKYTPEEIDRATHRLGASLGGVHGFEFTHQNVTEELEAIRREDALEEAGFRVGDIQDLLKLTDEDMEVVSLRLVCHRLLVALRKALGERDEAKEVIGQLGERIKTLLVERDEGLEVIGQLGKQRKTDQYTVQLQILERERDEARAIAHARSLDASELEAQNLRLREAVQEAIKCRRFLPKDERQEYQGLCDGCADGLSRALEPKP